MSRGRTSPIGLDVGARWIKAVQVSHARSGDEIVAAARVRRVGADAELGRDEADALLGVLSRQGFRGDRVVLSAPHDRLIRHGFELPPRESGAPVAMLARAELARVGRCAPDSLEMCWWETPSWARSSRTGSGGEGTPVYALGMQHASAEELIAGLEACGLQVIAIDAPTTATARAADRCSVHTGSPAAAQGTLLVEIGWSNVCISAFACGVPVYERMLEESGIGRIAARLSTELKLSAEVAERIIERVGLTNAPQPSISPDDRDRRQEPELLNAARKLITSHIESTLDDVRASIAYATRRYAVAGGSAGAEDGTPVYFVGGGCLIPGLGDRLSSSFSRAARVLLPGECMPCGADGAPAASDPSFVCALGLALHDGSHPGDRA